MNSLRMENPGADRLTGAAWEKRQVINNYRVFDLLAQSIFVILTVLLVLAGVALG